MLALRGLVSNFPKEKRDGLIQELNDKLTERLSLKHFFDPKTKALYPYKFEAPNMREITPGEDFCVKTAETQTYLDIIGKCLSNND